MFINFKTHLNELFHNIVQKNKQKQEYKGQKQIK